MTKLIEGIINGRNTFLANTNIVPDAVAMRPDTYKELIQELKDYSFNLAFPGQPRPERILGLEIIVVDQDWLRPGTAIIMSKKDLEDLVAQELAIRQMSMEMAKRAVRLQLDSK